MAFRASKERKPKAKPVAQGNQLIANAGIEDWYYKSLKNAIGEMVEDYSRELTRAFSKRDVQAYYTADASPISIMKRILRRLNSKWREVFAAFANTHAESFAKKGDDFSQFSARHSLKKLGIDNPKDATQFEVGEILKSSIAENVALITNIQQDFANEVEGTVYRSLASNNPEAGSQAVVEHLKTREGITDRRAKMIARDQNSKLYTNLNKARMEVNGVEKFRWKHSSAGKKPRHTHIDRERQDVGYGPGIFRLDSPELWEGPKNDQGLPGEAINCRCRMIPIINLD